MVKWIAHGGCGWMISCMECGRAFIFARVVEIDSTYEATVAEDAKRRGLKNITADDVADVAAWTSNALAPFPVGATIVYLDGEYFAADAVDIEFDGVYAHHKLDRLPHTRSREEPDYIRGLLGQPGYWRERERADRDR